MQVSISKAAEMVGVTRATLYRHIDKKGITVGKDEEGNPKIDVSELIRVYGNKVKTPEDTVSKEQDNTKQSTPVKQGETGASQPASVSVELEVLRERVKHLEESKTQSEAERKREREQFEERIEQLQETLTKAQDTQNKTTLLLEHYTKEGVGGDWQKGIKALEERIANQEEEARKRAEKEEEEKRALLSKLEEQEQKLQEEQDALKLEKSKSFLHKLLGS